MLFIMLNRSIWGIKEIVTYGKRLRSTHCIECEERERDRKRERHRVCELLEKRKKKKER